MANVNIGQIRTLLNGVPAGQLVHIQAGTLTALLNLVKTLQGGSDAAIALAPAATNAHSLNLTSY